MNYQKNVSLQLVILLCLIFMLSGCASIVSGRNQQMSFQSNPDEATLYIDGRAIGKTPITIPLQRKKGQMMEFKKDGFKPVTMQLTTHLNGWFWGNILTGGLLGSTTDGITGAATEYSPSQYFVTLQPEATSGFEFQATDTRAKLKEYIVACYRGIQKDLLSGKGEYIDYLFYMLKIPISSRTTVIADMIKIDQGCSDSVDFANKIAYKYFK
jgi:hypothetical protein